MLDISLTIHFFIIVPYFYAQSNETNQLV